MMQCVDPDEVERENVFTWKYWRCLLSPSYARNADISAVQRFANYLRDNYVFGKDPDSLDKFEKMLNVLTDASLKIPANRAEPVLFSVSQIWSRLAYHYLHLADEQLQAGQFTLGLDLVAKLENNLESVMIPLSTMLSASRQSFYAQITELKKGSQELSAQLSCEKMLHCVRETFQQFPEESKRVSAGKEGIAWLEEEEVKIFSLSSKLRAKILVWKGILFMDFIGNLESAEESFNWAKQLMDLEEFRGGMNFTKHFYYRPKKFYHFATDNIIFSITKWPRFLV